METPSILIVEDEAITACDLQERIGRLGYQVSAVASSGEEAVRYARELRPDLILMDVKLSGTLNGLETSRRINQTRPTPIVYLTAYPSVFLASFTEMQEPRLCLSKPLLHGELQRVLEVALGK